MSMTFNFDGNEFQFSMSEFESNETIKMLYFFKIGFTFV